MAKKRKQNKNFASKRAKEAEIARNKEASRQSIITGVVLAVLTIAIVGGLTWWSNQATTAEPEPTAIADEDGETTSTTSSDSGDSGDSDTSSTSSPTGTLIEGDRPLAAIPPADRANYYSTPPEMTIDTDKEYEAVIVTENGDITLRLFDDEAPITVNNFIFLANQGYYDDTSFHRVIPDFMAQAGDPLGVGIGGPGYSFEDEFDPTLRFDGRGILAMANSGPATNGSQFFITFAATEWLNDAHTIFGEMIAGDDALSSVRIRDPQSDPEPGDKIVRIDIYEK